MKNPLKNLLAVITYLGIVHPHASADVLASYDVTTTTSGGVLAPTTEASGVSGGDFGFGSGFTGFGSFGGYGAYISSTYPTSLSAAETSNTYLTFTIQATPGNELNLSSIDLSGVEFYSQNFTGTFSLESSVTGFGSEDTLASYTVDPTSGRIDGSPVPLTGFTDLTAPVEFRFYVSGVDQSGTYNTATLNSGTVYVNGAAVPEPGTYALMGLGLGLSVLGLAIRRRAAKV